LRDWVEKTKFSPLRLGTRRTHEKMKERFPMEEDPREVPHNPLRPPVTGGEVCRRGATDHRAWGEIDREILREKATIEGFKYPWTRAQPDIV
jgi:hypothetical protein